MSGDKPISLKEQAWSLYLDENLNCAEVAAKLDLSVETVRDWSKKDGWRTRRRIIAQGSLTDDVPEQAEIIRRKLVESIVEGGHSGRDLASLVEAWTSTLGVMRPLEDLVDRDDLLTGVGQ